MEDPLRDCMGFRLGAAWRRLDRLFNRAYSILDLSHAHAQVLLCVLERREIRMADIVPLTGLTQPTVSRLAADLSKHRYLRRVPDPTDARAKLLSPSKRAERVAPELRRLQDLVDTTLRREFAEEEFAELRALLDLIAPKS
ncbi:MAG: MarR family winged helix-turn-helix transcriptional regulator [Planctomycetota bacterium]